MGEADGEDHVQEGERVAMIMSFRDGTVDGIFKGCADCGLVKDGRYRVINFEELADEIVRFVGQLEYG